jgi:hypothetical protein
MSPAHNSRAVSSQYGSFGALGDDERVRQIGQILDEIVRAGLEDRERVEPRDLFLDPGPRAIAAIDLAPGIEDDGFLPEHVAPGRP